MKKSFLTIVAATLVSVSTFAQIPNNSFENWTSAGSYSNPDGWDNLNSMMSSMSIYGCTQGTGGATGGGLSYLKLTTKNVGGMGMMPGVAVCGVMDMMTYKAISGFPYTQKPQSLAGSWMYMPTGSDVGFVSVYLTKWNSGMMMRDTIAFVNNTISTMVMNWTNFSLNLTYNSSATPDSAIIIFSASGTAPVANSYLYVDNLSFTGGTTGVEDIGNFITNISAYPNPATENISIELNINQLSSVKLQLVDLAGKLIKEVNAGQIQGKYNTVINTTGIIAGTYFLKVSANGAVEVKKIIIQ